MKVPLSWFILLGAVAVLGVLVALLSYGVIEVSGLLYALSNVVLLTLLFVFAVLGGAFAGMLMTHRLLADREFSPMERTVLETNAEVKALGKRLAAIEDALARDPLKPRP